MQRPLGRAAISIAGAAACLLDAAPLRADEVQDRAVFAVQASCPNGHDRRGTAFLVKDWPDAGELALVTSLHVVYGCSSLSIETSRCDALTPTTYLEKLTTSTQIEIRAWPRRDLVVFRHLEQGARHAWAQARPSFGWQPQSSEQFHSGQTIVVAGANGKNYCFTQPGPIESPMTLAIVVQKSGSLGKDLPILTYRLGGPGASGGPITLPGGTDVVAIHEAGFPDNVSENAAIVALPDGDARSGEAFDRPFPSWNGVSFDPPPNPQALALLSEEETARLASRRAFVLNLVDEYGGPIGVRDGFDARLEGEVRFDLARHGEVGTFGWGLAIRFGTTMAFIDEIEKTPGGVPFDTTDRAHFGVSLPTPGAYARLFRASWSQLDVAVMPRVDVVWEAHEGQTKRATWIPGGAGDLRWELSLGQNVFFSLGGRGGVEYAPAFAYAYSVFPVRVERDGYRARGFFGLLTGIEAAWR